MYEFQVDGNSIYGEGHDAEDGAFTFEGRFQASGDSRSHCQGRLIWTEYYTNNPSLETVQLSTRSKELTLLI